MTTHQNPSVAIDLALCTIRKGKLCCMLQNRTDAKEVGGDWALPGGFVHIDESVDATANRILATKAGAPNAYIEQLYSFGDLGRDPRQRVISIAYFALTPLAEIETAIAAKSDLTLAEISVDWQGETGGPARAVTDGIELNLAFDHDIILGETVKRLRGKLDYTLVAYGLLPTEFTLREIQEIHEAILNQPLTKPAFRRKLLDKGQIVPTGRREAAAAFRPAELYRLK